jgi:hypothetical protein
MQAYDVTEKQDDEDPMSALGKQLQDFRSLLPLAGTVRASRQYPQVQIIRTHQCQSQPKCQYNPLTRILQ